MRLLIKICCVILLLGSTAGCAQQGSTSTGNRGTVTRSTISKSTATTCPTGKYGSIPFYVHILSRTRKVLTEQGDEPSIRDMVHKSFSSGVANILEISLLDNTSPISDDDLEEHAGPIFNPNQPLAERLNNLAKSNTLEGIIFGNIVEDPIQERLNITVGVYHHGEVLTKSAQLEVPPFNKEFKHTDSFKKKFPATLKSTTESLIKQLCSPPQRSPAMSDDQGITNKTEQEGVGNTYNADPEIKWEKDKVPSDPTSGTIPSEIITPTESSPPLPLLKRRIEHFQSTQLQIGQSLGEGLNGYTPTEGQSNPPESRIDQQIPSSSNTSFGMPAQQPGFFGLQSEQTKPPVPQATPVVTSTVDRNNPNTRRNTAPYDNNYEIFIRGARNNGYDGLCVNVLYLIPENGPYCMGNWRHWSCYYVPTHNTYNDSSYKSVRGTPMLLPLTVKEAKDELSRLNRLNTYSKKIYAFPTNKQLEDIIGISYERPKYYSYLYWNNYQNVFPHESATTNEAYLVPVRDCNEE